MRQSIAVAIAAVLCAAHAAAQSNEEKLIAHTDEFRQEVIEVTEGVHVAIGFGLANSILIEGDDGVIIVDAMESKTAARAVKAEFDKITSKPVKAIVYTHNHYDHVHGAEVFAEGAEPEIIAQSLLPSLVERRTGQVAMAMFPRNIRQFGITLPDAKRPNAGIGPKLVLDAGAARNYLEPTITFDDELEMTIAGVKLKFVHAPGETDDQLYVWLPEKRVLCAGDNYYLAFPNLYAIRGTPYRDVRKWADSLDLMLNENPAHLVPSHTRPLEGEDHIREVLSNYRDAIRAVYNQTIAGMNRGLTPDELVEAVELHEDHASKPYLQEFYGTVPWAVRSIFAGNLGWFDGNATNLFPLPPKKEAENMVKLAGGADKLLATAEGAIESDPQWAAELADHLLVLDPENDAAKLAKGRALVVLARQQISANARNYLMTSAQQLGAEVPDF